MAAPLQQGLTHLGFQRYNPAPALLPFVDCCWSLGEPAAAASSRHALYPDGGTSLTWSLAPSPHVFFEVLHHTSLQEFTGQWRQISVRLLPGACFALFGVSPASLSQGRHPIAELFTATDQQAMQQLLQTMAQLDNASAVEAVSGWLVERAQQLPPSAFLVQLQLWLRSLASSPSTDVATLDAAASIAQFANTLGISRRTLERRCVQQVGLTPHALWQQHQLKHARLQLSQPDARLADVAHACGFYDQAHFQHVFRSLALDTPARYRQRKLSSN